MKTHMLVFVAPAKVEIHEEELPPLSEGEVLIQAVLSAISAGTEMLVYRGQFPRSMPVDSTISGMANEFQYPLKYGYCLVGRVIEVGPKVSADWRDKLVFLFHPHQSHLVAPVSSLIPLPNDLAPEEAVFLPNMETAVNFMMDAAPLIGEQVAILGQGVVGLLTAALLGRMPLADLLTVDEIPERCRRSIELGAHRSVDPQEASTLKSAATEPGEAGFDLVIELTGSPSALDLAIELVGFDGRIVIGSWYGEKKAPIDLGGKFHRSRIKLISSQVSTIAPALQGRWSKQRRLQTAWNMIQEIRPSSLITHRIPLEHASDAYHLLDKAPAEVLQVVFTY